MTRISFKYVNIVVTTLLNLTICMSIHAASIDIYAHRGMRALLPENTLPAYAAALRVGVDVVDMDVNMTKDGVLVVTHDLTLNPQITKDRKGRWIIKKIPIKSLTLKQLKTYTVGDIKRGSQYAGMYPNHINEANVHIPTLLEVIRYVQSAVGNRVRFQIEMKTNPLAPKLSVSPQRMSRALAQVMSRTYIIDNTEVQAFQWRALLDLKKLIPNVKTAFLTGDTTEPVSLSNEKKIGSGYLWTAPLLASDFNYDYPKMVHKLKGSFWEPYEMDLTRNSLTEAHRLGLRVVTWAWTEQEKKDFNYKRMQKLIDWRVDGIITDRPGLLRSLEASNQLVLASAYPNTPWPSKF